MNSTRNNGLGETLRIAEQYLSLQHVLDDQLREGFLALTGVRMTARPGVLLLLPMTWPATDRAQTLVSDDWVKSTSPDQQNDESLRSWCGGFKPSSDVVAAKLSFSEALDTLLEIAKARNEIALKSNSSI